MRPELVWTLIGVGAMTLVFGLVVVKSWRQVPSGKALVLSAMGKPAKVAFDGGAVVLPFLQKAEVIDISVRRLVVECRDVRCSDDSRVDVKATCYVRVNKTMDDVLRVAQTVGCDRASSLQAVEELFLPKFADAFVTVAAHFDREQLAKNRDEYKDQVIAVIGHDLNGFVLDDIAIDRLEPAGFAAHDPEGRGRVERDGSDEVAKLRREVDALRDRVAALESAAN